MNKRRILKAVKRISRLPKNKYFFLYAANKIKHLYLKLIRSTRVAYPSTIMLELTNHCNLSCTTCPREYNYGKEMELGIMPIENAKKVIDYVWPYLDSIGLTGMGETFLFRQIEEVVDYIKSRNKGIIVSVSTNAMIPGFIEKVSRVINKIDTIQISVDGIGDVYEKIRIGASFNTLDENLRVLSKLCRETETDLILNMVVTKENYDHMPRLVKYAEEIGLKYVDFTLFNLAAVTNIQSSYYDFYKSENFLTILSELETTISNTLSVEVTNRNFRTANGFRKCPFPWTHFYICWNGYVPPCCAKPFPKVLNFGNVFDNGLMTILNNQDYREFRRKWYLNKTPDFCEKCHFIGIEPVTSVN
ncbi:MAG TPA: radical SAM protein [Bacteroidales bacterium]|nr:radical SAM protein [Bacteroidales bacterium]